MVVKITEIIKILRAGECCEVISDKKWGRITVSEQQYHDFYRYPITTDETEPPHYCRDHHNSRLIVTVEGLGFANIRTVFADEEITLISLNEAVGMHILSENSVRIEIMPHAIDAQFCKEHAEMLNFSPIEIHEN